MANNIKNRWHKFARQATGVVALLGLLLGANQAFAQASVAVTAPANAVGGDIVTFQVSMSSSVPYTNATYKVDIDASLQNVMVTCGTNVGDQGPCATPPTVDALNVVTGTIPNLGPAQSVLLVIRAKVPTEATFTGYSNPSSISTKATLTPPNSPSNASTGNTTVNYKPYTVIMMPIIVSPSPTFSFDTDVITFESTYENTNPNATNPTNPDTGGPADGIWIQGGVYTADSVGLASSPWVLQDLQYISCIPSGGAVCPTTPFPAGGFTWNRTTSMYQVRVPVLPVGGKIVVRTSFKIAKPSVGIQCDGYYQGSIANITRIGEGSNSDEMRNALGSNATTIPVVMPPCPITDLQVIPVQVPTSVVVDTDANPAPTTVVMKYRNEGPLAANVQLNPYDAQVSVVIMDSLSTKYQFISETCTSSSNVACPGSDGIINNMPPGSEVVITSLFRITKIAEPTCGNTAAGVAVLRVNGDIEFSPPGIEPNSQLPYSDSNPSNNSYSIAPLIGYLPRSACPVQDLGAVITSVPAALKFGVPYVVKFRLTNHGAGDFVWAPTSPDINGPTQLNLSSNVSAPVQYTNATLTCTPNTGAVCPQLAAPPNYQTPFSMGGYANNFGGVFGMNNAFSIPENGSLDYVLTLMPTSYTAESCGNGASGSLRLDLSFDNITGQVTEPIPDQNPNADFKQVTKAPICENLVVNKTMMVNNAQVNSVNAGENLYFVLEATAPAPNRGGVNVSNMLIEDVLPAGFVFSMATANQLACVITPVSVPVDAGTVCASVANGGIVWDAASRKLSITTPVLGAGSKVAYTVLGTAQNQSGVWNNIAALTLNNDDFVDVMVLNSNTSNGNL